MSTITIPTHPETCRFIAAVQAKSADVALAYNAEGRNLFSHASPAIKKAVGLVSDLQRRHSMGDRSHTLEEEQALKDYSRWLVEAWHRLRGTEIPSATWINEL